MARLPVVHAVALRLRDVGASLHTIAVAIGVDDDQVPPLLTIADSKLERLLSDSQPAV
jgi:hypothetical protein